MIKIYYFLSLLIYPILPLFLKIRILLKKECPVRFGEKLGNSKLNQYKNVIWFHVASLGEIKSIYSIIKYYQKNPNVNILITSVTLSSSEYFDKHLKNKNTFHQFAPLDSPIIISKFLQNWKPKLSVFVESEIWPNMILQTSKVSKLILLNARISKKSFKKWKLFKNTFKKIINKFDYILAQSNEVLNFLKYFNIKNIKVIGNIKFTNIEKNHPDIIKINKKKNCWAAMSIHYEEIEKIINTHIEINKKIKNLTTFLIPRHLNKIGEIEEKIIRKNINIQKISTNNKVENFDGIILIDKFGLAEDIFNQIKIVFMGGSFKNHGGQNPIEPLKYGCKIYSGYNIHSFTEIYRELLDNRLAKLVKNEFELKNELIKLFELNNFNENKKYHFEEFSNAILIKTIKFLDQYIF